MCKNNLIFLQQYVILIICVKTYKYWHSREMIKAGTKPQDQSYKPAIPHANIKTKGPDGPEALI